MQRAGKGIGRQRPVDVSVQLGERSTSQIEPASPAGDSRVSDWLRALEVLQKHWRLSAAFALVVMVTVIAVTYSDHADLRSHGAN